MSRARIRKLVSGVHMGLGHAGLKKLLEQNDIDLDRLEQGDLIMCLNKKGDKLKVIGFKGLVLGYLKMPRGERIMGEALQYIPHTFGVSGFNYDNACKRALGDRLREYRVPKNVSPTQAAQAIRQAGL